MCILCVIQKWSRRVATMLPWLVIPLIGLWALSQLLPPAFRFEITSPRLACLFVLLVTLFWYEILMPQLSAWRVRRNARLRERKRFEAIELQKLRKTATRRCRNCLTAYRDQNPGGGRFMCSYCGHISKRPVLDLPVPPGLGISGSGIIKDLVGKGGKMLNGKGWTESGWMCGQDWLENGSWAGAPIAGSSTYRRKNISGVFGGDEDCLAEKSYSGFVIFACRLLTSFFLSIRWLWRKIFRVSSPGDESSSGADQRGMLIKRGENGANCHRSRGERARRKAEEKRQARLEKELLEEEERKQREEVARLVEERRRLRDEMMKVEKDHSRLSPTAKEKDQKKEAEKKRQERRKDKDKGSSKSSSDAEELEKRAGKDAEWKHELESNNYREHQKHSTDDMKSHSGETGHGLRNVSANSVRGSTGNRYFDRMKGTFLSSSKAFTGGSFFSKGATTPVTAAKDNRANNSVDHAHVPVNRRDLNQPERVVGKSLMNGDDRVISRPVLSEPQPGTAPKKAWHQLFTRSPSVKACSNVNVISRPNPKTQSGVLSPPPPSQQLPGIQTFDNPISFGLPSPFNISTFSNGPGSSSLGFSSATRPIPPRFREGSDALAEEPELFQDPCYHPDPKSLLGPVSESLDHFLMDVEAGVRPDNGMGMPHVGLKNMPISSEINRPSPIESPLSWTRVADERHSASNLFPSTPKSQETGDAITNDKGIWQMWSSSPPLGQDGLGLVDSLGLLGTSAKWLSPQEKNGCNKEDFVLPSPHKTSASLFSNGDPVLSGGHSPRKVFLGNSQNGGTFSPVHASSDHDPWASFFPALSSNNPYSLKTQEESANGGMRFGSPNGSATDHLFEPSPVNFWPKKGLSSAEGTGKHSVARPPAGGLFSNPDVQSFW